MVGCYKQIAAVSVAALSSLLSGCSQERKTIGNLPNPVFNNVREVYRLEIKGKVKSNTYRMTIEVDGETMKQIDFYGRDKFVELVNSYFQESVAETCVPDCAEEFDKIRREAIEKKMKYIKDKEKKDGGEKEMKRRKNKTLEENVIAGFSQAIDSN